MSPENLTNVSLTPPLHPVGGADHRAPGGAADELARIAMNCLADKAIVAELHSLFQSLAFRVRGLEMQLEADRNHFEFEIKNLKIDRDYHAARLKILEARCSK